MTHGMNAELAQLLTSALRTIFLAGLAALGLTAFRVKTVALRLFVWRAVLFAALAMPFLGRMLPPLSAPAALEFLPANVQLLNNKVGRSQPTAPATVRTAPRLVRATTENSGAALQQPSLSRRSFSVPWNTVAAAIYLVVTLILLTRFVLGIVLARRLVRASKNVIDPRFASLLASYATNLSAIPQVAESDLISVPVTIGALSSTILLPSGWREWDDAKLNAVIAHEISHVTRRDAFTRYISVLHRAIFWFSPLAWWLDRHLGVLAEEASDEAALACGADRNVYAKTLLGFFEVLQTAPGRVWWQGVSMANGGPAERRLERILAWKGSITMNLKKSITVAIVVFAIPVVYLVASVRPAGHMPLSVVAARQTPESASGSQLQPPAPPSSVPAMPAAPVGGVSISGPPPVSPIAPVGPTVPVVPESSWSSQSSGTGSGAGYSYAYGFDDEERFVIVSGKTDVLTMSGSTQDARHVEKLRKQIPGDFIWFQRDEKSYIIRDQATIERAKTFWAPQEELGKKQEALGKQQEALGKQQEALGAKMEQVRVNVPDMTAALDSLKAKLQKLGPSATMEQIGDLQSEIGELQSKIGEIQSRAGEQQSKLGEEQGRLGEKQGKLGEQQGELGRQQGELARQATIKMKALLDEAIKNGMAQPEPEAKNPTL